jgi:glycerol-3-phosphate acyltransferase PlsX
MGSAFAQAVMGVESPRVALLSNGTEPTKGTEDLRQVYQRLSGEEGAGLRFVGNIEGTDVLESVADVVVTDGFSGNIALKLIEGVSGRTMKAMRMAAMRSWRAKLGGFLLAPSVRDLREEIDPETTGGAYMLGLRQLGVVAHGRFSRRGFAQAIEVAARGVEQDVIARTHAALQEAGALHIRPHHRAADPESEGVAAPPDEANDSSTTSERAATVAGQ